MASWTDELEVFCADIGSLAKGKFAWARRLPAAADGAVHLPSSIDSLGESIAYELGQGRPVAVGFEMPLFAPVPLESSELGKARPSDKNAPAWCSGIGASVLATGLVQVAWLLERLHAQVPAAHVHLNWESFDKDRSGLLLWEAFVTRDAKGETDEDDAAIGVQAFCEQLPNPGDADAHETERPLSFVAALAHWAGWEIGADELRSACVLVRAHAR